jgi:hypothetical protein
MWLIVIFMLPETLRYRVGNGQSHAGKSWLLLPPRLTSDVVPESQRGPKPPKPTLSSYWRLFTYAPIGIVSTNTAILYSTYFSMMVALPHVLEDVYSWSTTTIGAGYVAVGVGLLIGSLVGGRVSDWRRARMVAAASDAKIEPESRLVDQIWGVLMCVAGTAMFGWFVHGSLHVASILMATFLGKSANPPSRSGLTWHAHLAGFGMSWVFVASASFLGECAPLQAAGAFALGNMLRNPGAAIAAVLYPSLVKRMGIAWFFTGFAALDLVFVGSSVLGEYYWRVVRFLFVC